MFKTRLIRMIFSTMLLVAAEASAVLFDTSVSITASVDLNVFSDEAPAGFTQYGTFYQVISGVATSSTVDSALNVTGTLPLGGVLTDISDGVSMYFQSSGNSSGGTGFSNFFGDYNLLLDNTSMTDTFKITLGIEFTNEVDANGENTGINGEIILRQEGTEIFSSNLISDTLGDEAGRLSLGNPSYDIPFDNLETASIALLDVGTILFDFTLIPGQTMSLTGQNDLRGDLFDGNYKARVESRIFVNAVVNQTTRSQPVPEPAGLWLFAAGLMSLRVVRWFR